MDKNRKQLITELMKKAALERQEESKLPNLIKNIEHALSYENIHSDKDLRKYAKYALFYLRNLL